MFNDVVNKSYVVLCSNHWNSLSWLIFCQSHRLNIHNLINRFVIFKIMNSIYWLSQCHAQNFSQLSMNFEILELMMKIVLFTNQNRISKATISIMSKWILFVNLKCIHADDLLNRRHISITNNALIVLNEYQCLI